MLSFHPRSFPWRGVGLRPLPLYVRRSGPPGRFMICHMKKPDPAVAARVPPGQALTEKWPVLTYGRTPRFDPNRWTFRCFGLVERPTSWTWEEFLRLPRVTVRSDIHCVTRWSKLDNDWEGVSARYIVEQVKPRPEATFVLQHADPDYTTNTALADLLDDDVVLAVRHNGKDLEPDHGGPMRLVLPKLYFWKSSKWLRAFEFLEVNPPGFWEQNGYHMNADPWTEERYSDQETRAMRWIARRPPRWPMRSAASRRMPGRAWPCCGAPAGRSVPARISRRSTAAAEIASIPPATDRWAPRACSCPSPRSPPSPATRSPVGSSSPSGAICACWRRTPCSASSAGAGACRWWTAGPYDCRG